MKSQSILRLCYSAARQQPALCTTYQVTTKKKQRHFISWLFSLLFSHVDGLVYMNIKARRSLLKIN